MKCETKPKQKNILKQSLTALKDRKQKLNDNNFPIHN